MKININIEKAKEIHKKNLRNARTEKLQELDVQFQRELEQPSPNTAEIAQKKQELRDLPQAPEIEQVQDAEELKSLWPVELLGENPYTIHEVSEAPEESTESSEPPVEEPTTVRARNEDGTFMADDPETPDVNEAWITPETPEVPQEPEESTETPVETTESTESSEPPVEEPAAPSEEPVEFTPTSEPPVEEPTE